MRQEMTGVVGSTGINWTICKQAAPRSKKITTPTPHHSINCRQDALPDAQSTVSKHWSSGNFAKIVQGTRQPCGALICWNLVQKSTFLHYTHMLTPMRVNSAWSSRPQVHSMFSPRVEKISKPPRNNLNTVTCTSHNAVGRIYAEQPAHVISALSLSDDVWASVCLSVDTFESGAEGGRGNSVGNAVGSNLTLDDEPAAGPEAERDVQDEDDWERWLMAFTLYTHRQTETAAGPEAERDVEDENDSERWLTAFKLYTQTETETAAGP